MSKRMALAAAVAAHGSLGQMTNISGLVGPLRTVEELVIEHLVLVSQPRQIIPPALLQHLVEKGRNHPPDVLQALQSLAESDETARRILEGLAELAATIRPPGQVHAPILCYRDGEAWVIYSGHRRCLASLLVGRNTVPAIEISRTSPGDRELDRIAIETAHEDWTAIEQAMALRDTRDKLRAEWAGKILAELELGDLGEPFSIPGDTERGLSEEFSDRTITEPTAPTDDGVSTAGFSDRTITEPLAGRQLEAVVTATILRRTGLNRRQYYLLLALADKLCSEAQLLAQRVRLTESQLRSATKLTDQKQQVACIKAIAAYHLTQRDADALVEAVLAGANPAEEAARLAGVRAEHKAPARVATPTRPEPARPAPPQGLRRPAQRAWRRFARATNEWQWVRDDANRVQWAARFNDAERSALWELAAELKEISELLMTTLQS